MPLHSEARITDPDGFYEELVAAHFCAQTRRAPVRDGKARAALAQTGSHLLMTIAVSFIIFSLWGWLTNTRVGH